ncbi:MAG: DUF4142 domain-containing protein [Gammaproteobacteria bacterium]
MADAPAANPSEPLLVKAMQASMVQVELGRLAQKNAQSTGVNALGARMERDHARIGKILTAISRDKGIAVSASLDSSQRALVESLDAKKGAEFDAAYAEQMVSEHGKVIALFTAVADSGDADLARLAKRVLPMLVEDQRLAGSYAKLNPNYDMQAVARRE